MSCIEACGALQSSFTKKGVHIGRTAIINSGIAVCADIKGSGFIKFTYPNQGVNNSAALIECNMSNTDPILSIKLLDTVCVKAIKNVINCPSKMSVGSFNNSPNTMDINGTCRITGDTTIGGT